MSYIYHWGPAGTVAAPWYRATLDSDGFIHCSYLAQIVAVADSLYADAGPLEIAAIAPERLRSPVVAEDCYESGEEFPHVYGPLDAAAIVAVVPFPRGSDGYRLPADLPTRPPGTQPA